MVKKLAKTTLTAASILTGAAFALASASYAGSGSAQVTQIQLLGVGEILDEITVGANESGTAYDDSKGPVGISASVDVQITPGIFGRVKNWKTWLEFKRESTGETHYTGFKNFSVSKSYPRLHRPVEVDKTVVVSIFNVPSGPGAISFNDLMIQYCNIMAHDLRGQGKSNAEIFSQDRTINVDVQADLSYNVVGADNGLKQATYPEQFSLICQRRSPPPDTASHFDFDPGKFKINGIKLFLSTYSNADSQANAAIAKTCKKGQIKVRLMASKAGPAKFKLWTKVGAVPMTSKVIHAWASSDGAGGFKAEYVEWVTVDKTTNMQAKAEEMVSSIGLNTPWKDITLACSGSGSGFSPDTSDYKATGLLHIGDTSGNRCPRLGQIGFSITANYPFPIDYQVQCNGINQSGTLQVTKIGNGPIIPQQTRWKGTGKVMFQTTESRNLICVLRHVRNGKIIALDFKSKQFNCKSPIVNTGSPDLGVPTLPDPDRPRADWTGSVTVADSSGPHTCPRLGQVVFGVNRVQAGVFNYRIGCSNGASFTGSATGISTGGVYKAFGAHTLNITKTRNIQCTLQEVKPNGARVTIAKSGHDFTCRTPITNAGSGNLVHGTNPSSSTDTAGKVKAYVIKRRLEAAKKAASAKRKRVKRPVVSILCKPGYKLMNKSCVKKPVLAPVVQISCAGGTVRKGVCVCPVTHKRVHAGANAWRCIKKPVLKVAPKRKIPAIRVAPKRKAPAVLKRRSNTQTRSLRRR